MPSINKIAHLNDDLQFLVNCCKTNPSEEDIEFIFSFIQNSLALANAHCILPLVYKTIKKLSHLELNSDTPVVKMKEGYSDSSSSSHNTSHIIRNTLEHLLIDLKSAYSQIARRNMLMSAELIRIMKLLEDNGIGALSFKGPALSQMAYGDITLRQYGDLDILVDEKIAYKAGELLQGHGFTASYPLSILKNKTYMRVDSDFAFVGNSNNVLIEMHWRLFRKNIGHHLIFDQFSKDPQTVKINGVPIKVLSSELHLLYLALHGSKHAWERIEWIVDIDRFIRSNKLDNEKLKEIFVLMKADRPILTGLLLAQRLFQTPIPAWIIKQIEKDNEVGILYKTTIQLLNNDFSTLTEMQRARTIYLYQIRFFKSRTEKIKYFFESYLSISRNDCLEFPLPVFLNFLYIFIKPFRTLKKQLGSKK